MSELIIYFIGALFGSIGGFAGGYWAGVACAKRENERKEVKRQSK